MQLPYIDDRRIALYGKVQTSFLEVKHQLDPVKVTKALALFSLALHFRHLEVT